MLQIRVHARGGQGGKTLAQIIAEAGLILGRQIQAFPEYGPERQGAPTVAFVRIDDKKIRTHEVIKEPNIVIILDDTLLSVDHIKDGIKNNTVVIVNTTSEKSKIKEMLNLNCELYIVHASRIAIDNIGSNKPNTAILGALCRLTDLIDIDACSEVIKEKFVKKGQEIIDSNIKTLEIGNKSLI